MGPAEGSHSALGVEWVAHGRPKKQSHAVGEICRIRDIWRSCSLLKQKIATRWGLRTAHQQPDRLVSHTALMAMALVLCQKSLRCRMQA